MSELGKLNEHQLYLGSQVMDIFQQVTGELETLCMRLGPELTREEVIEIVKVRLSTKLDLLKLIKPPVLET